MDSSLSLRLMFVCLPIALILVAGLMAKSLKFLLALLFLATLTGSLALSGLFSNFEAFPPRLMLLFIPLVLVTVGAAFSSVGARFRDMPIAWLIGFQAFRLPLELMIHKAVNEGVAPPQLTWTGMNYDIIPAISVLFLVPFASRVPTWTLWCWNMMGILLLVNVITVAIISIPGPFKILTPANIWVAYFPFVWLPTICVMAAIFGHLVITRKLLQSQVKWAGSVAKKEGSVAKI